MTTVRLPDGSWRRTLVSQRFDVVSSVHPPGNPGAGAAAYEALVQQTLERRERSGLDDADVTLVSTAWVAPQPVGEQQLGGPFAWRVVDHADGGAAAWLPGGPYWATRLDPRGPGEPLERFYDASDGRLLFASSVAPLSLDPRFFPHARLLAYWSAAAQDPPPCLRAGDLGVVSVVGADGRDDVVVGTTLRAPAFAPPWRLVDPASGRMVAFNQVATGGLRLPLWLVLAYEHDDGEAEVRLALGDGTIDLARSQVPTGFRAERRRCDPTGGLSSSR